MGKFIYHHPSRRVDDYRFLSLSKYKAGHTPLSYEVAMRGLENLGLYCDPYFSDLTHHRRNERPDLNDLSVISYCKIRDESSGMVCDELLQIKT